MVVVKLYSIIYSQTCAFPCPYVCASIRGF